MHKIMNIQKQMAQIHKQKIHTAVNNISKGHKLHSTSSYQCNNNLWAVGNLDRNKDDTEETEG